MPLRAAALSLVAALLLAACGSSGNKSSSNTGGSAPSAKKGGSGGGAYDGGSVTTPAPSSSSSGSKLTLQADPGGALRFSTKTLAGKAGKVTLVMKNPSSSGAQHAIAVEGNGVDQDGAAVSPGGTSTVSVKLKPGRYKFYCPVDGHEKAGMEGTLTIR